MVGDIPHMYSLIVKKPVQIYFFHQTIFPYITDQTLKRTWNSEIIIYRDQFFFISKQKTHRHITSTIIAFFLNTYSQNKQSRNQKKRDRKREEKIIIFLMGSLCCYYYYFFIGTMFICTIQ